MLQDNSYLPPPIILHARSVPFRISYGLDLPCFLRLSFPRPAQFLGGPPQQEPLKLFFLPPPPMARVVPLPCRLGFWFAAFSCGLIVASPSFLRCLEPTFFPCGSAAWLPSCPFKQVAVGRLVPVGPVSSSPPPIPLLFLLVFRLTGSFPFAPPNLHLEFSLPETTPPPPQFRFSPFKLSRPSGHAQSPPFLHSLRGVEISSIVPIV